MYKAEVYVQNVDIWCKCSAKISWEDDYGEKMLKKVERRKFPIL